MSDGLTAVPPRRPPSPQFLVSALCLYLAEERVEPERRELDLFMLAAPAGSGATGRPQTWWTVDAHA